MTDDSQVRLRRREYDVVIVGAGITGAIVAKVLAENALREQRAISILILEAGRHAGLTASSYGAYVEEFYRADIKTPNSPYPNIPNAPSPEDIAKLKAPSDRYFRQDGPLPFGSTNVRTLGGTTLHWMGIALRMIPADFRMKTNYQIGEDWPICYQELKRYYEMAEWEIGVSATREDLLKIRGVQPEDYGDYEFPMSRIPPSYLDHALCREIGPDLQFNLDGQDYPVRLVPIPQGRNAMPNPHGSDPRTYMDSARRLRPYTPYGASEDPLTGPGQRCEGNASCIPICPSRAKYSALKTAQQLSDISRLPGISVDLVTKAVAVDIKVDASGLITHIDFLKYESEGLPYAARQRAIGRRFVLASGAIENAKLLLASRTGRCPEGVANSSRCVGQNLMDHPFILTWALMPKEKPLGTFRGPGVTSDLPMRDGAFRKRHAAFRTDVSNWGWGLPDDAPSQDLERMIDPESLRQLYADKPQRALLHSRPLFGAELRRSLGDVVQRQLTLGFLLEQLPQATNRVTIDNAWRDQLGVHRPVINYDISEYTREGMLAARRLATLVFSRLGATEFTDYRGGLGTPIQCGDSEIRYIGAGHMMGTHKMGLKGSSVVDTFQRSWDHNNLYIVGCGSMPTAGTSNPTLTAAALCIKTAEHIFKTLDLAHR